MKTIFIFVLFILGFVNTIIVFEPYTDNTCTNRFVIPGSGYLITYLPVTDYTQGIDGVIKNTFYNNVAPATVGKWFNLNSSHVTFKHTNGTFQTWNVVLQTDTNVCVTTPMYAYGRFYDIPRPVLISLKRTTGSGLTYEPDFCYSVDTEGWVVYGLTQPILNSTSSCPTLFSDIGIFWNGGSKISLYYPSRPTWGSKPQPCGPSTLTDITPGTRCATTGLLYCVKNANCMLDHIQDPKLFPTGGLLTYTVKIVTSNAVGEIGSGISSTTDKTSSPSINDSNYVFNRWTFLFNLWIMLIICF